MTRPTTLTEKQFWQQAEVLIGMLDAYALFGDEKYWQAFRNVYDFVFSKLVVMEAAVSGTSALDRTGNPIDDGPGPRLEDQLPHRALDGPEHRAVEEITARLSGQGCVLRSSHQAQRHAPGPLPERVNGNRLGIARESFNTFSLRYRDHCIIEWIYGQDLESWIMPLGGNHE